MSITNIVGTVCLLRRLGFTRSKMINKEGRKLMDQKKKTFSTMEVILVTFMVGSLLLSFLQSRQEEKGR